MSDTNSTETRGPPEGPGQKNTQGADSSRWNRLGRILFLLITIACFAYLYYRLDNAAAREGLTLLEYMAQVFANVQWVPWLLLMMCYSVLFFLIDTLVVTRSLNWFVARIRYRDIMPIRASAYIISIFNEQIGKGAMAYYLNRRDRVSGWEVSSVMLFIMFCEFFYLLFWATTGYFFSESILPDVFVMIPVVALIAIVVFTLWVLYFRGWIFPRSALREGRLLHAFRHARLKHYFLFFLIRSPALLAAVIVYAMALNYFGVDAGFLDMLVYLPVIFFAAAVPTPMRAAAITLWVVLFPQHEGELAAFGFLQHNFFIFFNAIIGLLFWKRAQRELFGPVRS